MLRFYPILWAFTALAGLASVHPALAASINGTVTLSPGGQPASGVWVSAVRLGDYLTNALDPRGCVMIATGDTMSPDPITGQDRAWSLPLFVQQDAGPSLMHGLCGTHATRSGFVGGGGSGSTGERGPLAGLGALLLLGAALLRVRRTASVVAA